MTTAGQPIVLDVVGKDIQGGGLGCESGVRHAGGTAGSVQVWRQQLPRAATDPSDPRVSRNANAHWSRWKRGEIPEKLAAADLGTVQNMGTPTAVSTNACAIR